MNNLEKRQTVEQIIWFVVIFAVKMTLDQLIIMHYDSKSQEDKNNFGDQRNTALAGRWIGIILVVFFVLTLLIIPYNNNRPPELLSGICGVLVFVYFFPHTLANLILYYKRYNDIGNTCQILLNILMVIIFLGIVRIIYSINTDKSEYSDDDDSYFTRIAHWFGRRKID
jgi:hypothetical protein